MSDYTCARCGGDNCRLSADADEIADQDGDDRLMGWCDDCGDFRPLVADDDVDFSDTSPVLACPFCDAAVLYENVEPVDNDEDLSRCPDCGIPSLTEDWFS